MKIENLVFSVVVLIVAIVVLAIFGWCISFIVPFSASGDVSDVRMFGLRVLVGIVFIGLCSGINKLWDLFLFCLTEVPLSDKK